MIGLCLLATAAGAQTENDTIALQEVEVKAARITERIDGKTYVPSEAQRENALTGYSLLGMLAMPMLKVDDAMGTVSAIDNRGDVQLRINGVLATRADLQSIQPKAITRVDYIDNPGVRYGDGVGYVIDIHVRHTDDGYSLGADLSNALTSWQGTNDIFAAYNRGKSQLNAYFEQSYYDLKGSRSVEEARYLMADGSTETFRRTDAERRERNFGEQIRLKYNLTDSLYVFQASLSTQFSNAPRTFIRQDGAWTSGSGSTTAFTSATSDKDRTLTPVLDLYFSRQMGTHQSLEANVTGTYIRTRADNTQDEGTPYAYGVEGRTHALHGEAIYENRLKPFTLSAGLNGDWKYSSNRYTGDTNAENAIHTSTFYAFGQLKGAWQKLRYALGLGLSNQHYRQGSYSYDRWLWRPKASLAYTLARGLSLNYNYELSQRVSLYAMTSDARIRKNSREWTVGNPSLKPYVRQTHQLQLSYSSNRLFTSFSSEYRLNRDVGMEHYERTDDGMFLQTQTNQKAMDMFFVSNYTSYDLIPGHLTAAFQGGIYRFHAHGDDYRHHLTSYNASGWLQAYLGKWTLFASLGNGWSFLEGERMAHNTLDLYGTVSYRFKNGNISLSFQNPFMAHPLTNDVEHIDRLVTKSIQTRNADCGNYLALTVRLRLNKGQSYRESKRTLQHSDHETGILK